jgi:hypothetical protein
MPIEEKTICVAPDRKQIASLGKAASSRLGGPESLHPLQMLQRNNSPCLHTLLLHPLDLGSSIFGDKASPLHGRVQCSRLLPKLVQC